MKTNIKNALVWVVLTAISSILIYIIGVGDVFNLDTKALINIGAMSLFNGLLSLIKSLMTNNETGKIAGIKVKQGEIKG